MKKILGLDLGTTSIGWAYVLENKKNGGEIKKLGVRIIPLSTKEKNEFNNGNQISTNAARTLKRGSRRNNQRFKQRRDNLISKLLELDFIQDANDLKTDDGLALYEARARAVSEKVSKVDFAKILVLINKKRGYQSNRKANNDESQTDYLEKIVNRDRELTNRGITVGQKLFELLQSNPLESLKNLVFLRISYVKEFDAIWQEQSKYYSELTSEIKHIIRDRIIFFQRDLKSQKGLLSKCMFEKSYRVIPVSSPVFQEFRIWQRLHDIRIKNRRHQEEILSQEEKEFLFDILQESEELTGKAILKKLKLNTKEYSLNFKKIQGNVTRAKLLKIFTETGYDIEGILDLDMTVSGDDFDKQPFMQLWHLIYSAKDDEKLVRKLKEKFFFNEEQAREISKINYRLQYGSLSTKAIRNILPFMEKGLEYSEACSAAGYRHSDWMTKEENEIRKLDERLELVRRNSLRNPVVEKVLNQVVNLVNAIIDDKELGRPDEIRIEMARELKMPAKKRKSLTANIRDKTKRHEKIRKILLEEYGLKSVSRNDIIKYKLADEVNWISIYSGKPIDHSLLFTSNYYDIEHIIPKSRLFDDSYLNKTICEASINKEKGNRTAFDYMETLGESIFKQYLARVDELGKLKNFPKAKHKKLLMQQKDIPTDFINRQINETQYIARATAGMLKKICRNVLVTSGAVTALLRESWELPFVIQELNLDRYRALNQTKYKDIKTNGNGRKRVEVLFRKDKSGKEIPWSKRQDHRHHAVDALVVACTKQAYIQKLNTLNQQFDKRESLREAAWKFLPPWKGFRDDTKKSLESLLVSYKEKNKVTTKSRNYLKRKGGERDIVQITETPRGPLHKETIYGKNRSYLRQKTPLKKVTNDNLHLVCDKELRDLLSKHLKVNGGDSKKTFNTKKNPIFYQGNLLEEVQMFEEYYVVRKPINKELNIDKVVDGAIRKLLESRLDAFGNDKSKAFADLDSSPIYLNKAAGIVVKSVRVREYASQVEALHHNGEKPVDFVFPKNNHHIAFYREEKGKVFAEGVSFFDAVKRKLAGEPVVKKEYGKGVDYLFNIQKGDFFIFFDEEVTLETNLLDKKNYAQISKRLYRVQKISMRKTAPNIMFRHHYETTVTGIEPFSFKHIQSLSNLIGKCQKVQVNILGDIIKVGEY